MSAERRLAMVREIERAGMTVSTRESKGLLIVDVSDHRGQIATSVSTHRFDIEEAYEQFRAWQQMNRPRATTKIARINPETRKTA